MRILRTFLLSLLILFVLVGVTFAGQKTLTFGWNQEISADFAGWKLYKSTSPNVVVNSANLFSTIPYGGATQAEYTSAQILQSPDNSAVTYYFVLTAFDNKGNESLPSNEVFETIDFQGPGKPVTLRVTVTN